MPPLLILVVMVAGRIWGPDAVQRALESQFAGIVGQSAAQQIHQMIAHGQQSAGGGRVATIGSIAGLILGATGAFLALQDALNRAWEVKPDPKQGGIRNFIVKRLLSLGMVLGLGFLFAVSLALTAAITALGSVLGGSISPVVMELSDLVASLVVLTLLFAALFKVLPDATVAWRDVWVGGAFTALLFVVGKFAIGYYLGRSNPGDAFGAASALAVILVWAYYAALIVLFGAEFTRAWATARGSGVVPSDGAVRVVEQEVEMEPSGRPRTGGVIAASTSAKRSGVVDWLLGLPVLYLLMRAKGRVRR
jgi:membrane protein